MVPDCRRSWLGGGSAVAVDFVAGAGVIVVAIVGLPSAAVLVAGQRRLRCWDLWPEHTSSR